MILAASSCLLLAVFACAAIPLLLYLLNLQRYRPPSFGPPSLERVAVLIPLCNNEHNLRACVESILRSEEVNVVIALCDTGSTDGTLPLADKLSRNDRRIDLLHTGPIQTGWNPLQQARWKLARAAANEPLLLFLDADVRLHPWAIARAVTSLRKQELGLLSGFPRFASRSRLDRLVLPAIHFLLLGLMPLQRAQSPRNAIGSDKFLLCDRRAYFASGGHAELPTATDNGFALPALFRKHGQTSGLVDLSRLVRVRPLPGRERESFAQQQAAQLTTASRVLPWTLWLTLGQILPALGSLAVLLAFPLLKTAAFANDGTDLGLYLLCLLLLGLALLCSYLPRFIAVRRFREPLGSALLHPLGIALFLALGWYALLSSMLRNPFEIRVRTSAPE
ncbi:MAG: glycosyltransferase family 2 protein [Acidobacteriaceae bacterium]|nr:glycosyltransferase family 2 protein [Acidobacteriaceae bacterium]